MKQESAHKRVAIIGGGPGGYVAAIRAAQLGADVTLFEQEALGGTCLNVGCIPTKALLHTAKLYADAKNGAYCGVNAEVSFDFTVAQKYKAGIVKQLVTGVEGLLRAAKITVKKGQARLSGIGTVSVNCASGEETMQFNDIIIATGSIPSIPPVPGIEASCCIDSTAALKLSHIPSSMLIIGGGVIGVEFATIFATLGCKVTIVEMLECILPMMDTELSATVAHSLEKKGVTILTGAKVTRIAEKNSEAEVTLSVNGKETVLNVEKTLVAVGRKPRTEQLGLDSVGIKTEHGFIPVDDYMHTGVAGIYAVGDCNGRLMLAHAASAQGEIAAENIMGHKKSFSPLTSASCVYCEPECAGVGLTEAEAVRRGNCRVGRFPFAANGKALITGDSTGLVKVIVGNEHNEILGIHIVGPRATDLIAEAALAIGLECTTAELSDVIHAHPTLAEAVREALLATEKRAIHITN